MFDHVTVRASDRAATERFYDAVLPALSVDGRHRSEHATLFGNYELSIAQASGQRPVTTGLHLGLRAPSTDAVNGFWELGLAAGYRSDGEPGPRPQYGDDYYGAFLLDPDGNSIEAAIHGRTRERGLTDHLWLRTTEFRASREFWLQVAQHAALEVTADEPDELVRIRGPRGGSTTILATDDPDRATHGVHIAIPASRAAIDAWHPAMLVGGARDDGPPGARPYHPSYYAAFVRDPDGHSVELVDHGGLLGERW